MFVLVVAARSTIYIPVHVCIVSKSVCSIVTCHRLYRTGVGGSLANEIVLYVPSVSTKTEILLRGADELVEIHPKLMANL